MRNDADEWDDREDEARYWREYKGGGGRCGLIVLVFVALFVAAWAVPV